MPSMRLHFLNRLLSSGPNNPEEKLPSISSEKRIPKDFLKPSKVLGISLEFNDSLTLIDVPFAIRRDEKGRAEKGWDEKGQDGTGWDETRRDGQQLCSTKAGTNCTSFLSIPLQEIPFSYLLNNTSNIPMYKTLEA
ncbi:hypothetical protein M0804_003824 [Polistes exclamans]|nr:hypothetical protein M0804_003824 [Polistes exclamans]